MYRFFYNDPGFISAVVQDVLGWMNEDIGKAMTVKTVSRRAGYSKWHFQRLFRAEVGGTVARYIRQRRLLVAAGLLRITTKDMVDVGIAVGFSDRQAFYRVFRAYFGVAPSVFRSIDPEEAARLIRLHYGGCITTSDG